MTNLDKYTAQQIELAPEVEEGMITAYCWALMTMKTEADEADYGIAHSVGYTGEDDPVDLANWFKKEAV